MLGSSGTGLLSSKHVRVGVPMLGAVLIGYVSLSSVLDGRIQDHTARNLNESPKIPDSKKNKGKLNLEAEVKKAQEVVQDSYELKTVRSGKTQW